MVVDWVAIPFPFGEAKDKYIKKDCEYYGRNKGKPSCRYLISALWYSKYFWSNSLQLGSNSQTFWAHTPLIL